MGSPISMSEFYPSILSTHQPKFPCRTEETMYQEMDDPVLTSI